MRTGCVTPDTCRHDALRAALNLALADGHVTTDAAWKAKMRPPKDADRRRDVYLDHTQRRALIAKASPDLAVFFQGRRKTRPWPLRYVQRLRDLAATIRRELPPGPQPEVCVIDVSNCAQP